MTLDEFTRLQLRELYDFFRAQFPRRHRASVIRACGNYAYQMMTAGSRRDVRFSFDAIRRLEAFARSLGWRQALSSEMTLPNGSIPRCPDCNSELIIVVTKPAASASRSKLNAIPEHYTKLHDTPANIGETR